MWINAEAFHWDVYERRGKHIFHPSRLRLFHLHLLPFLSLFSRLFIITHYCPDAVGEAISLLSVSPSFLSVQWSHRWALPPKPAPPPPPLLSLSLSGFCPQSAEQTIILLDVRPDFISLSFCFPVIHLTSLYFGCWLTQRCRGVNRRADWSRPGRSGSCGASVSRSTSGQLEGKHQLQ